MTRPPASSARTAWRMPDDDTLHAHVALCEPCLALIVREWAIRRGEFGELAS